jgi:hypothetical protein
MRAVHHELPAVFNQKLPIRVPASSAIQALILTIGLHDALYRQVPKGSNCAVRQVCWALVLRDQRQHTVWFFICDRGKSRFGEPAVRGTDFLGAS